MQPGLENGRVVRRGAGFSGRWVLASFVFELFLLNRLSGPQSRTSLEGPTLRPAYHLTTLEGEK